MLDSTSSASPPTTTVSSVADAVQLLTSPPPAPSGAELPYHWTQGNAPQAHKDAVAVFGGVLAKRATAA